MIKVAFDFENKAWDDLLSDATTAYNQVAGAGQCDKTALAAALKESLGQVLEAYAPPPLRVYLADVMLSPFEKISRRAGRMLGLLVKTRDAALKAVAVLASKDEQPSAFAQGFVESLRQRGFLPEDPNHLAAELIARMVKTPEEAHEAVATAPPEYADMLRTALGSQGFAVAQAAV